MKKKLDKRPTKSVEYELIGQNFVARTFTSIVRDMIQKQMDMTHDMIVETDGHYRNKTY